MKVYSYTRPAMARRPGDQRQLSDSHEGIIIEVRPSSFVEWGSYWVLHVADEGQCLGAARDTLLVLIAEFINLQSAVAFVAPGYEWNSPYVINDDSTLSFLNPLSHVGNVFRYKVLCTTDKSLQDIVQFAEEWARLNSRFDPFGVNARTFTRAMTGHLTSVS